MEGGDVGMRFLEKGAAPLTVEANIRAEHDAVHEKFHALLASLSESDWHRQSLNPGWTNAEIMSHILFGFIIVAALLPLSRLWGRFPRGSSRWFAQLLDALTRPFNWINALGARMQATVFLPQRVGPIFDRVHRNLLKQIASIHEEEWQNGMYYPTKWDANFSDFMTLERVCYYPIVHFEFHAAQIAR